MSGKIQKEWLIYSAQVLPPDASLNQIVETKRAFFGGAGVAALLLLREGLGDPLVKEIFSEVETFIESQQPKGPKL